MTYSHLVGIRLVVISWSAMMLMMVLMMIRMIMRMMMIVMMMLMIVMMLMMMRIMIHNGSACRYREGGAG